MKSIGLIPRVNNVLENTPAHLLREVLIIDDLSTVPVAGWENEPKVRIIRTRRTYSFYTNCRAQFGID